MCVWGEGWPVLYPKCSKMLLKSFQIFVILLFDHILFMVVVGLDACVKLGTISGLFKISYNTLKLNYTVKPPLSLR